MKKIQGFLTCVVAAVAGLSLAQDGSQANSVTAFDSLKLSAAKDEFSVTTSATNGCTVTAESGKVSIADGFYVIEGELSDTTAPFTVTQNPTAVGSIERFSVAYKASFVDEGGLATAAALSGAKIGFALTGANAASYYNGSAWASATNNSDAVKLAVTEDAEYTLQIDYDAREETKKARFIISTTPAYTSQWVTVGTIANNTIAVLGSGSVKSLSGANYTIEAEVIIVTPGGTGGAKNIEFTTSQMDDLRAQVGGDATAVATALSSSDPQANGNTAMDNYVLFGKIATTGDKAITANDKPVVKGVPQSSVAGKIKVALTGLDVQNVKGAKVQYKLMGRAKTSDEWSVVEGLQDSANFEFVTSTDYRYFKVVTVVTYQ